MLVESFAVESLANPSSSTSSSSSEIDPLVALLRRRQLSSNVRLPHCVRNVCLPERKRF